MARVRGVHPVPPAASSYRSNSSVSAGAARPKARARERLADGGEAHRPLLAPLSPLRPPNGTPPRTRLSRRRRRRSRTFPLQSLPLIVSLTARTGLQSRPTRLSWYSRTVGSPPI